MIARTDAFPPYTPLSDLAAAVDADLERTAVAVARLRAVRDRSHTLAHREDAPAPADWPASAALPRPSSEDPEC